MAVQKIVKKVKPPRAPSARNQEMWAKVTLEGWTQKATGEKFEISQSRVSRIVRQVAEWIVAERPAGGGHWEPTKQLSYANQIAKMRLERQLHDAEARYALSCQEAVTVKEKDFCEVDDQGEKKAEKVIRRTRETTRKFVPQGDFRYLNQQMKLTKEIRDVDVAQSQLPPLPPLPQKGQPRQLTREEFELEQKCMRNWHNALIDLEIARTGIPLFKLYPTQQVDLSWYDRPIGDACTPGYIDPESEEGHEMVRKRWEKDRSRFDVPREEESTQRKEGEEVLGKNAFRRPLTATFYLEDDEPFEYPSAPGNMDPKDDPYYLPRQISPYVTTRPYTPEEIRQQADRRLREAEEMAQQQAAKYPPRHYKLKEGWGMGLRD